MTSDDMNSQESRMAEESFFSELYDSLPWRQLPGVDRDSSYALWAFISSYALLLSIVTVGPWL